MSMECELPRVAELSSGNGSLKRERQIFKACDYAPRRTVRGEMRV